MRTFAIAVASTAFLLQLPAQQRPVAMLPGVVRDSERPVDERCAALCALQDHGALDVDTAVAALRTGADLGLAAASILRHEWGEIPAGLLDAISDDAAATALLLRELALAPRPSLTSWARSQVGRDKLPADVRCLALAAACRPLSGDDADLLIATAVDEDGGDGYRTAAWLLDPKAADRLIGRLHGALLQERTEFSRLLPFFDRLSPRGYEQLIGMVAALPDDVKTPLVRYFAQNDVPAFRARTAAALDGEIPLETVWLTRTEGLLDQRGRVARLLGVLRDPAAARELQEGAFRALVQASVLEEPVLQWVEQEADRLAHIRRLLDAGVEQLPAGRLVAWLEDDVRIAETTAAALLRRPQLEPEIEATLCRLLDGVTVQGPAQAFAMALLYRGGPESVAALWPGLRASPIFAQFTDALARRRAPWGHALLLAELEHDASAEVSAERAEQLDAVRLALVTLGDRRQLDGLVARARVSKPGFVRRCTHYASPLGAEHSLRLLADAKALDDEDLAVELIAWAATTRDPAVERELLALWQPLELSERQLAALRGLAVGRSRPALVSDLRAAIAAGPLDDRHEALCYELISTMPTPLTREDVALLAEVTLILPLADPERERAMAERWHDGRFGFPMVAAVAQRLRGGDPELAGSAFGAGAVHVRAHPELTAFAPQRLLVLWRSLIPDPSMQWALGRATAGLLLALPNPAAVGTGPASLFASEEAEQNGDLQGAAAHARIALANLLRLPGSRSEARVFLGERDPGAGEDPWAGLSARPWLLEARRAIAAADRDAAVRALATAGEFAGRDAVSLQRTSALTKEIKQ